MGRAWKKLLLVVLVTFWIVNVLPLDVSVSAALAQDNAVLYYDMETMFNATALDDLSPNANYGVITGALSVTGMYGQALDFDGIDDKVAVGDVFDFAGTLPFTVMAWVKPEAINFNHLIFFKMSGFNGWELFVLDSGNVQMSRWNNTDSHSAISDTVLVVDTWFHVAATYDGLQQQIYVNGVADGSAFADTMGIPDTAGELTIGRQAAAAGEPFNGTIDDAYIFNTTLTQTQIQNVMNKHVFHGVYDEDTGLLKPNATRAVNVTTYFSDGSTTETFEVNGTYEYGSLNTILYFSFNLTNERQYWVGQNDRGDVYIFDASTTVYTISFLDLAGVLDDYPFVEAQRYVNGTLRTVEKRRVDEEKKIVMSLINGEKYTLVIKNGVTYTYGDLTMTSITTVQLTLKGIDFPKETLLTYPYIRIYGTRSWSGDLAYALSYDGQNDYVAVPDDNSLDITNETAIMAWIYLYDYSANRGVICEKIFDRYELWVSSQGKPSFILNLTNNGLTITTGNTILEKNTWHHLGATFDGTLISIYVNGELDKNVTVSEDTITTSSDPFYIGYHSVGGAGYVFNGIIDEVGIYNRSILESEISYSYNDGAGRYTPQNQTGLVGWWHFNEGIGSTAYDETANDNDGTISGASWASSTVALGLGTITITYQDTLELTNSVDIYINYKNGTNIYNATETADSFIHTWASALDIIDYAVVVDIDHQRFGTYTWKNYFPRSHSVAPWGLGWFGTLPFDTSIIIPMLLILFAAGAFSQINAEVGAFMAVVTAALLTYMGWIAIEPGALITGVALAFLMALIYGKRRVQT